VKPLLYTTIITFLNHLIYQGMCSSTVMVSEQAKKNVYFEEKTKQNLAIPLTLFSQKVLSQVSPHGIKPLKVQE